MNDIQKIVYGLIGNPLSHSFSKQYFEEKFDKENLKNCFFNLYELPSINDYTSLLEDENLKGLAVTIPYKQSVIPFLDNVSDAAKKIGAVNCIHIKNGKTIGYNTDVIGFENSLQSQLTQHHTKALVLGTGGASKAVQFVLQKLKIQYLTVSREQNTENNVIAYSEVNEQIIQSHLLIINCTPLGMYPNFDTLPDLPYQYLSNNHLLYDLVYKPAETSFLSMGKKYDAATKNGFEMLVLQAEENWKIWNS